MIIPVRCFTCGKVIGNKWEAFCENVEKYESLPESSKSESKFHQNFTDDYKGKIMDEIGVTKICCRRHLLGHVDIVKMK